MEFRTIYNIDFVDFDEEALEQSWIWLNDPELKHLTMTPDIDRDGQRKWFEGLKSRPDYYIKVIKCDNKFIGALGLKAINGVDAELWGYIGDKEYWGKTVGLTGMQHLIDYAISINLQSIYVIQLKENIKSYKLVRRCGFQYEKDLEENKRMLRLNL